jgi:hypothetical protein
MKCDDVQELFADFGELPVDDLGRKDVEAHIANCAICAEAYLLWQQSESWLMNEAFIEEQVSAERNVSGEVMKRIYEQESWRIPVADRIFSVSLSLRRNLTLVFALCISLFLFSFLYAFSADSWPGIGNSQEDAAIYSLQAPSVLANDAKSTQIDAQTLSSAVASLSPIVEPLRFEMGPIKYSHFLLVLSVLGIITMMLVMNWLSRTKK